MHPDSLELLSYLKQGAGLPQGFEWAPGVQEKILVFYEAVLRENALQNLTRLTLPKDFYEGHVLDVCHFLTLKASVVYPAVDLGSGVGVPGLLAALMCSSQEKQDPWILCESERNKAEYLLRMVTELGLENSVDVFCGRAETFLAAAQVGSVVIRAVGTISKIYSWIGGCSSWNILILFKGPKWDDEWNDFKQSKFRNKLKIESVTSYSVGGEGKVRKIVRLVRV